MPDSGVLIFSENLTVKDCIDNYVFQVITGLLQADEGVIVNSDNCAQLFAHEATRVFHDRLVDHGDRTIFFQMLADNCHDFFKVCYIVQDSQIKLMLELLSEFTNNLSLILGKYIKIQLEAVIFVVDKL